MGEKTKKSIRILIIIAAITGIMVMGVADSRGLSKTEYMYATVGDERINAFWSDGKVYFFMPSYADDNITRMSPNAKNVQYTVMHSANLPTVYIDTKSGKLDDILADKEYSERAKIRVYDEDGNRVYSGGIKKFGGRGNYSWMNWEKKPYRIVLKEEVSLLGLGTGTGYALYANASDATLVRNDIAFNMEQKAGVPYSYPGRFCDLYVNGDYAGNYYLKATIDVGSERVNITDMEASMDELYDHANYESYKTYETEKMKGWNLDTNPDDITGGYIIEREYAQRYDTEYATNESCFITDMDEHFIVSSPRYCSKEQIEYLAEYMNEVEEVINSADMHEQYGMQVYDDYIDERSFAAKYLVNVITKNYDAGVSSEYFYKDSDGIDDRLYAGPGWDYDMSLGNYLDWMEYHDEPPIGLARKPEVSDASEWYTILYEVPKQRIIIEEKYKKMHDYIDSLITCGIDEYRVLLQDSAAMDAIRWKEMYKENGYTAGDEEEYAKLADFLHIRCNYLDEIWNIE
ncbi:MAG: CotH kinase family protein [Lachnospiraceae bacterium]|nr:CotH kinase family protein [Candidatus Colinaster equi]